jgi:hypothetical protein
VPSVPRKAQVESFIECLNIIDTLQGQRAGHRAA